VRLLVPLIDTELPLLAAHAADFATEGCRVAISTPELVTLANDKALTVSAFAATGIDAPTSYTELAAAQQSPHTQLFIKPRNGSASAHTYACTPEDVAEFWPRVPNPIVQERLGGQEITIDALFDFQGQPLHYVARNRIRTVGGESIVGVTVKSPELHSWM